MSDQNFSEVDKLLSSDFDEPKKKGTPKPEAEVTKTETPVFEEKQPETDMVVEEVKTTPRRGRTPKKAAATTPTKKASPKKATPTKSSPKKVEKEIVTDPLKVSTRKSTKHSDWSELIYGSSEKFAEGDTLAVRAPKDSGDQFWLCALDGFGTEENNNKDDLEITWYEAKGTAGVYVEGEEDDIAADSVICRTRLNMKDGTWVLPQVELKAIRDTLKLEREESSEIILEGEDEKSDEGSDKGEEEEEEEAKPRPKREEKPKREAKSGDKRKAAAETNGEPKPKRAYKKREKKVTPEAATGVEGMAVEPAKTEPEPPTTTTTTFPGSSIHPSTPTPIIPTMPMQQIPMQQIPMQQIPMQQMPMQQMAMQQMPMHMSNHMQHMYMHPMMGYPGGSISMPNQMPIMPQIPNHVPNHPVAMHHQMPVQTPIQQHTPTPTATEIVNQPVESKTEAV
jgi:hypothetical protein